MLKNTLFLLAAIMTATLAAPLSGSAAETTANKNKQPAPVVVITTNKGRFAIELLPEESPLTVANFLQYVDSGFYDGTIFHRVMKRFVIQGGGLDKELVEKNTRKPIKNESRNRVHNEKWTVAMARTDDPHSATSQFFINLRMNTSLDYRFGEWGYTVFGRVIEGKEVVNDISLGAVQAKGGHRHLPVEPVIILSAKRR